MSASVESLSKLPATATGMDLQVTRLLNSVSKIEVSDRPSFVVAAEQLREVKGKQKSLEELRITVTGPLNESIRRLNDWFRAPAQKLRDAERILKEAMGIFQRKENEQVAREQAAVAAKAREQREALEARAKAAEKKGNMEKAEELTQRAQDVVAAPTETAPVKAAGMAFGTRWRFHVIDPTLVPREFLTVDESKIRRYVETMKGDANIAGVRVWSEAAVSARAK